MDNQKSEADLEKLLSLSSEELKDIFSKLTVAEVEQLLSKLEELNEND